MFRPLPFQQVCATCAICGLATFARALDVSPVQEAMQRLQAAYSNLEKGDGSVELQWETFTPSALEPPRSPTQRASDLILADPASGRTLFAQWRYRAIFGSGDRFRIEKNDVGKTLGAEKARWGVRMRGTQFNGESSTLTSRQIAVSAARPYRPDEDDLFDHEDAQSPNTVAHRLILLLKSTPQDRVTWDGTTGRIETDFGPVSFSIDPAHGGLSSARYRARHAPKDILVEYEGAMADGIYPAPQPAFSRIQTLEPGEAPGALSLVSRFSSAVLRETSDPAKWSWQSVAPLAVDTATKQVLRADGTIDAKQTRNVELQRNREPVRWEEPPEQSGELGRPVERVSGWRRWGLTAGMTAFALAGAMILRSRISRG